MPWARHPWMLPVVSGVIAAFGYFTLGLVVPNFVAFVPLLAWIDAHLDAPARVVRNGGFAFGMTLHLLILSWMRSMVRVSFLGIFAYIGLALIFAVGITLAVLLLAWLRKRTRWSWAVLLPSVWLSLEWAHAQGDLRMTAQHVAQALGMVPFLVQFADLVGPYGVGAVLLVSSALLYESWSASGRARRRALGLWGAMIAVVLAYDAWAWTHPPPAFGTLRVAFLQPNVGLFEKMDGETEDAQGALLERLTRRAADERPDVVIWPETARPYPILHNPAFPRTFTMPEVQALAKELRVTIVTGVEYGVLREKDRRDWYNAVVVVHPDGTIDPTWSAKVYLVPFVEQVPFRFVLGPILSGQRGWLRWLAGGFEPGHPGTTLDVAGTRLGVTVCYEELFFDLHRTLRNAGATIQAVVTNDAWFGRTFFQNYQANTVRLRAIENRTSIIRVANSGISMFVDPLGRDGERTELDVEDVRVMDLPLTDGRTVYDRIGDAVAYLALAVLAVGAGVAWRRRDEFEDQRPDLGAVP